ncbi:hypothetical protein GF323_01880 [Candidatus Woesearchaeota archaeon]|nr:hypothetical protein [Candidatus Woesearchaeota archaeon]
MEFLFLIGFVSLIAFAFILATGWQIKEFTEEEKKQSIVDFGDNLKNELDVAAVVKDGYARQITLPKKIDSTINYSIEMRNSTLIIITEHYRYAKIVPKTKGRLEIGKNRISKVNNTVIIKNV